ncbi:MAG TPA: ribonuclease HI family protein [Nitrospirae bacterium]|nr:ribonuclease HI family protein [Nitrospirota bacterium]
MKKALIYTDGASSGNPGPAGIGVVIEIDGQKKTLSEYIGETTNNVAEYTALVRALQLAHQRRVGSVEVFTDSELLVKQLNGQYRVRNEGLLPLYRKVTSLLKSFKSSKITHIPREQNREADRLSKDAIKKARNTR